MEKSLNILKRTIILIFICLVLFSINAHAAIDSDPGILDNVLTQYQTTANVWSGVISARATWLFWLLATISMVWTFGIMALRKADIGEFFAEFIRFTVTTGFFWWLLVNGPAFAISIMDGMSQMAANASGNPIAFSPSSIVDIGFGIFFKAIDQSSVWSPIDTACGITLSLIVLVVLALVAVNMLILLICGWILAYAGIFFLGFGGARWTSEMAIGYFKTVLGLAIQLMTMILLVGIGKSFVDQYYNAMSVNINLKELGVMLIVAVVLLALVDKVPPMIGAISGCSLQALGGGFGAGSALGAMAAGSAAIATAGTALAAGAIGTAGGAKALMAAFSQANASASGGGSGTGNLLAAEGGGSGSGTSGSGSSLTSAMGDPGGGVSSSGSAGAGSSGMAGTLAAGAWEVAKAKGSSVKENITNRIDESTGGKIAAAINARSEAKSGANSLPSGADNDENSLSSGAENAADVGSEVAAFRDRGR